MRFVPGKLNVYLVVGVNGSGKTTLIGKLAHRFVGEGRKVIIGAGDTFRAAAEDQLAIWCERAGAVMVRQNANGDGADPASVIFDALERAKAEAADVVILDTAGRLQNKSHLMEELRKIVRVLKKQDEHIPHAVLLVLDSTTGQNAYEQVRIFNEMVQVTGLVVTKLDGSAKGGVLVGLADQFGIPVHYIGVGEGVQDLQPFTAQDYARSLLGL